MKITLEDGPQFSFVMRAENGARRVVNQDRDYPEAALAFGWACPAGDSHETIWAAWEFLDQNIGAVADDPGYF